MAVYCTLYRVHCSVNNIHYLINLNFSLNILIKNSDKSPIQTRDRFGQESDIFRTQIRTRVKFGQVSVSDKSPVTDIDTGASYRNKYRY